MQAMLGALVKKGEIDRLVIEVFFTKQLTTHCTAYRTKQKPLKTTAFVCLKLSLGVLATPFDIVNIV